MGEQAERVRLWIETATLLAVSLTGSDCVVKRASDLSAYVTRYADSLREASLTRGL